jgi:hypothetical protein
VLNTPDPATFYGGDRRGYADFPALTAQRVRGRSCAGPRALYWVFQSTDRA